MKAKEIQAGSNVKDSSCSGTSNLWHVCEKPDALSEGCCEKPENLHVCEKPDNLNAKGAPGNICCGGGMLSPGAGSTSVAGTCDSKTNLCTGDDTLNPS